MPRRSASHKVVRRAAADVPPPTPAHLAHLRAVMDGPIDVSDIPERAGRGARVVRDEDGRLPRPAKSMILRALLAQLRRRGMTRYGLWKKARTYCPTISESAVYEYLRGRRQIGVAYIEALMRAAGLTVTARKLPAKPKGSKRRAAPKEASSKLVV
jgi:hypothetical protein